MGVAFNIFLILHFVGLASVLGGFLVQMRGPSRAVNPAMLHGALTQLVTGIVLVGLLEMQDEAVDHAKIGVKLALTVVIAVLAFVGRRRPAPQTAFWATIGALAFANVVIAVVW